MPMHDNTYQRTVGDFVHDARTDGLPKPSPTAACRDACG